MNSENVFTIVYCLSLARITFKELYIVVAEMLVTFRSAAEVISNTCKVNNNDVFVHVAVKHKQRECKLTISTHPHGRMN